MEVLNINSAVEFSEKRRIKKRLMFSELVETEFLCYEPGQGTVAHHHVGQDEVFYIVSGRGTFIVEDQPVEVSEGDLLFIPAPERHGIEADRDDRLVILYFKCPGRVPRKSKKSAS